MTALVGGGAASGTCSLAAWPNSIRSSASRFQSGSPGVIGSARVSGSGSVTITCSAGRSPASVRTTPSSIARDRRPQPDALAEPRRPWRARGPGCRRRSGGWAAGRTRRRARGRSGRAARRPARTRSRRARAPRRRRRDPARGCGRGRRPSRPRRPRRRRRARPAAWRRGGVGVDTARLAHVVAHAGVGEREAEAVRQPAQLGVAVEHELGAVLDHRAAAARDVDALRPDPPADAVARLEHEHVVAAVRQLGRRGEPREPRADDDDPAHRRHARSRGRPSAPVRVRSSGGGLRIVHRRNGVAAAPTEARWPPRRPTKEGSCESSRRCWGCSGWRRCCSRRAAGAQPAHKGKHRGHHGYAREEGEVRADGPPGLRVDLRRHPQVLRAVALRRRLAGHAAARRHAEGPARAAEPRRPLVRGAAVRRLLAQAAVPRRLADRRPAREQRRAGALPGAAPAGARLPDDVQRQSPQTENPAGVDRGQLRPRDPDQRLARRPAERSAQDRLDLRVRGPERDAGAGRRRPASGTTSRSGSSASTTR